MPRTDIPRRGELYYAYLDPVVGHEQAGYRPFLVLSVDGLNRTEWQIVIGLPLTTTDRSSPMQVRIEPNTTGLAQVSYAMPEMVRSISRRRFRKRIGRVPMETVDLASRRTGVLIGLGQTRF